MHREDMDTPSMRWTLGFALVAAVLAGVQRELPHPWNFFMIGGLGLWAAARLTPWLGLLLPVGVWLITDVIELLRTGYPAFNPFVAAAFLGYGLLGLLLRHTKSPMRIASVCMLGSLQFYLLTNFSVWLSSVREVDQRPPPGHAYIVDTSPDGYPNPQVRYAANVEGLLACYALGLPFYGQDAAGREVVKPLGFLGNTLLGDLLFTGLLFGGHAILLALTRRRALAWRQIS